ncbi:response regulator [Nemorincola caseinilytica]|uniref:Response regulator n=1 Tax=Nemorincola caseinilytica TaxID=2054315 RepID=A0ABP8N5E6_9BACT
MTGTEPIEILLVEDDPYEAELAIRSLKTNNLGNSIRHIDDGADALAYLMSPELLNDHKRHMVLLDLNLPRVDGLEILRRLKADEARRMIPVIVLTSSKEEKDIIESYKLGVNSYIVKPVNFDSFSKAIADLKMYWLILNQWPPMGKS